MTYSMGVLDKFRELRDQSGFRHVFVVVDPLSGSVPLERWSECTPENQQWALRDPQMDDATFPCPKLLLLDEDADSLLEETIRAAGVPDCAEKESVPNPAICGWLFSRGIAADLARHLTAAMQQRNAKWEPVLLRYTDPRVLSNLRRVLMPEQLQQLLGPVEHWFSLDRFGRLSDMQTQQPAPYVSPLLMLTAEQWNRIERLEGFSRSLMAYAQAIGMPLPADREIELDQALERAASHGVTALRDAMTFALCTLIVHPNFDRHPAVAQALHDFEPSTENLAEVLNQLPEQMWHETKYFDSESVKA